MKEEVSIRLITHTTDLPEFPCHDFFHSVAFFRMLESTPMQKPCMAVAEDGQGRVVAHMLTIVFYHRSLLPPAIYSHGRVYGEGEYDDCRTDKEEIFAKFLKAVTCRFNHKRCFYIEFSDMSSKMLGYGAFMANGYFPVQWQEIHNSLHNRNPYERLSDKTRRKIAAAERNGIRPHVISRDGTELRGALSLLRSFFKLKPRRALPAAEFFGQLVDSGHGKAFTSTVHGRIVGVCICIYSGNNAYIWYLASRRKTYSLYHPATYTLWTAIANAYESGLDHVYFLDAGLPFKKNPFREFILTFGGKQVSKYRWFRTPFKLLNNTLGWFYSE